MPSPIEEDENTEPVAGPANPPSTHNNVRSAALDIEPTPPRWPSITEEDIHNDPYLQLHLDEEVDYEDHEDPSPRGGPRIRTEQSNPASAGSTLAKMPDSAFPLYNVSWDPTTQERRDRALCEEMARALNRGLRPSSKSHTIP